MVLLDDRLPGGCAPRQAGVCSGGPGR
jgi:hypothetical protein